ncbi:MAG: hypothetical protein Q7U88_02055 [Desulfocapsaceae bacterium]|nr:hypothetical protein [Desulfocapsaceae bacterium]
MRKISLQMAMFSMLGVPLLFIILSVNVRHLQGANYQAFFSDPSYAYLLNSLNIVNGKRPGHTDHPGTTVQLLGGLVLEVDSFIGTLKGETKSVSVKVLEDPESYIKKISNVFISIVAVAVFLFGMQVYLATKRLGLAIIVQAFPLSFPAFLEHLPRLEPEPLLVASSYLLATILVPLATGSAEKLFCSRRTALMTGIIMGIGVVTKVTFAPLLLFLFVFRGYKARLLVSIALVTTVIILTIPIWTLVPRIISWLIGIMTHSGRYGTGEAGLPSASNLLANGMALWRNAPLMFYFIPVLLISLLTFKKDMSSSGLNRFLVVILVVLISFLAITIKHPGVHYLMPMMALSGFLIVVISLTFPWRNSVFFVPIISVICVLFVHGAIQQTKRVLLNYQKQHNEFSRLKEVAQQYGCRVISYYYRSSSQEYALSFGNDFAGNIYKKQLTDLYPDFMTYNIWKHWFSGFKSRYSRTEMKDLLHNADPICLLGTTALPYAGQPAVKILEKTEQAYLYQFLGWDIHSTMDQDKVKSEDK